jgi:proteic killer suppression protein
MAIQSFGDKITREFFIFGTLPLKAGWRQLSGIAKRKLDLLHYAEQLSDLKSPPGNKLKALEKNLKKYHSIRINDQWRIVFKWTPLGPSEVQIMDYH